MSLRALTLLLLVLTASSAAAEEPVSIAVMEFTSKGGVTQDQMDALSDMLSNQIRSMGNYKVIGKSDIRSMLTMEEQRQRLSSCTDQSCLAEIGGALGARWVVVGNVSLFGKTYLLNLKLIDVAGANVASGVSRSIEGGEDKLLAELPGAAKEMFDAVADRLKPPAKEGGPPEEKKEAKETGVAKKAEKKEEKKEEKQKSAEPQTRNWGVWITASGVGLSVIADQEDQDYSCATNDIKGGRIGFGLDVTGGYSINRWLAIIGRLGGSYALGTRDGASRYRYSIDVGLGLKVSIPLDSWIEPVAEGTIGVDFMHDDNRESGSDSELVPVDGIGVVLDIGIGADFYFSAAWFMGLRGGAALRHYFQLQDDGSATNAQSTNLGLFGAVTTGWKF